MSFLETIGIIALVLFVLRVTLFVRSVAAPGNLSRYRHSGAYAFVTGSTDGIGKDLALALADRGFNVIVHGRNPTKLEAVKKEVQARYPQVKVESVLGDACTADPAELAEKVAHLPVSVLINNAGIGTFDGDMLYLNAASQTQADTMISTNMRLPTLLTRAMIPKLVQPALIVNVSSIVSQFAPSGLALYGSSKTYLDTLTGGIRREVKRQGLDIHAQVLQVGSVTTGVTLTQPGIMAPSPDIYARFVLDRIGGNQAMVMGYPFHWIPYGAARFLPEQILEVIFNKMMDSRKKAAGTSKFKRQ